MGSSFRPTLENVGGRNLILVNHYVHEKKLKAVKPTLTFLPPVAVGPKAQNSKFALKTSKSGASRRSASGSPSKSRPGTSSPYAGASTPARASSVVPNSSSNSGGGGGAARRSPTRSRLTSADIRKGASVVAAPSFSLGQAAMPASRVSRFQLSEREMQVYERFLNVLARFEPAEMEDVVDVALKDAQEQRMLYQYTGTDPFLDDDDGGDSDDDVMGGGGGGGGSNYDDIAGGSAFERSPGGGAGRHSSAL